MFLETWTSTSLYITEHIIQNMEIKKKLLFQKNRKKIK